MKTVLITGAAGFIGGALAKRYLDLGYKVVTIDNLSTGFRDAMADEIHFIQGNCQDPSVLNALKKYKFEAIFHVAGQSSGEISFDDPVYDLQTNAQSTLLLLKYALETGCKKIIYASSMSVYGEQPDIPTNERANPNPKSFYGIGKMASEHYMRVYAEFGIVATALRLFNIYGPGQNMLNLRQGMVSIFLRQAIKNRHIHVKGSPERYRDFVYIDDVIEAFLKTYEACREPGFRVFNVSSGVRSTIKNLLDEITGQLPFETTLEFSGSTPGDQFGIYGDTTSIKHAMNWEFRTSLNDGIKKMIDWALFGIR